MGVSGETGGADTDHGAKDEGPHVREAMGGIGRQIEDIISSAERFADDTRAKAEVEGRELFARRRTEAEHAAIEREAAVAELIDRVDSDLREVVASLDGLREQLLAAARGLEIAAANVDQGRGRLTHSGQDGAADGKEAGVNGDSVDAAHEADEAANPPVVLASQMALSGMSREEIAQTLRTRFAIADPEPIVDQALARER